jgi:hypothetical protein
MCGGIAPADHGWPCSFCAEIIVILYSWPNAKSSAALQLIMARQQPVLVPSSMCFHHAGWRCITYTNF